MEFELKDFEDLPNLKTAYARTDARYTLPESGETVSVRHGTSAQYAEVENEVKVFHNGFTLTLEKKLFEERYKRRDEE